MLTSLTAAIAAAAVAAAAVTVATSRADDVLATARCKRIGRGAVSTQWLEPVHAA
jgi:hypothetical protein